MVGRAVVVCAGSPRSWGTDLCRAMLAETNSAVSLALVRKLSHRVSVVKRCTEAVLSCIVVVLLLV